jgi:hypothetical protein
MKVESTSLQRDPDGGSTFCIMGTRLLWNGKKYLKVHMRAGISSVRPLSLPPFLSYLHPSQFAGTKSLASLAARPLTDKHREELIARGKLYCGLTKVCYLEYSGTLTQVSGKGMAKQVIRMRVSPNSSSSVGEKRLTRGFECRRREERSSMSSTTSG